MKKQWKYLICSIILFTTCACGFKPINSIETQNLLAISIEPSKVSAGNPTLAWEFDKILAAELHHGAAPVTPRYLLTTTLAYEIGSAVIQGDSTVSRSNVKLKLDYKVTDITTNKVIIKGHIRSTDSFDVASSPFSNYVADEESKKRLLNGIAADLRHRLYTLE